MAGGAFRQLIKDLYRGNKLINNEWVLRGQLVYLPNIRANLLTVIAEADHITPPCQSRSAAETKSCGIFPADTSESWPEAQLIAGRGHRLKLGSGRDRRENLNRAIEVKGQN